MNQDDIDSYPSKRQIDHEETITKIGKGIQHDSMDRDEETRMLPNRNLMEVDADVYNAAPSPSPVPSQEGQKVGIEQVQTTAVEMPQSKRQRIMSGFKRAFLRVFSGYEAICGARNSASTSATDTPDVTVCMVTDEYIAKKINASTMNPQNLENGSNEILKDEFTVVQRKNSVAGKRSIRDITEESNREVAGDVSGHRNNNDMIIQDDDNDIHIVERNEPMEVKKRPLHLLIERGMRNQENSEARGKDDNMQITESDIDSLGMDDNDAEKSNAKMTAQNLENCSNEILKDKVTIVQGKNSVAGKRSIREITEEKNREVTGDMSGIRDADDMIIQDDDNDIHIVERDEPIEVEKRPLHLKQRIRNQENSGAGQKDDDMQITESNVTNPLISFPHPRYLCGVHPFAKDVNHFAVDSDKATTNSQACDNCYCIVCDIPYRQCKSWTESHCHAVNAAYWQKQRSGTNAILLGGGEQDAEVANSGEIREEHQDLPNQEQMTTNHPKHIKKQGLHEYADTAEHDFMNIEHRVREKNQVENDEDGTDPCEKIGLYGDKTRAESRITEVLAHNLRNVAIERSCNLNDHNISAFSYESDQNDRRLKKGDSMPRADNMHGDIPQLNLHKSFFVEGVRIGWPYPQIMQPQRQMALHIIRALKSSKHVVIESPTGTGKSAAILCSVLAWNRYAGRSGTPAKIYYCSRTHSQVAQMVESLKKTPYRPRMSIIGSRDKLCIHKNLRPRGKVAENFRQIVDRGDINTLCQTRVRNTDAFRQAKMRLNLESLSIVDGREIDKLKFSDDTEYDDNNPPKFHAGDGPDDSLASEDNIHDAASIGFNEICNEDGEDEDDNKHPMEKPSFKVCPHYRQLSSAGLARKAHSSFIPASSQVNCCTVGGSKTKLGAHDIEDLCQFGIQPNIKRGVALYRDPFVTSFGLQLAQKRGDRGSIVVRRIYERSAAQKEGSIAVGDTLVAVNHQDVLNTYELPAVTKKIKMTEEPLLLDIHKGKASDENDPNKYSGEAACPYYLSRSLAKKAEIVFCPYNYILDPNIRSAMELKVENSIVVLDEAHNVEDTLRDIGSGKYGEIEMLKMIAFLSNIAARSSPHDKKPIICQCQRYVSTNRRPYLCTCGHIMGGSSCKDKFEEIKTSVIQWIGHDLLLFIEKILQGMKAARMSFENDEGHLGVTNALKEYRQFKCPHNKEFEMQYFGPTGRCINGKDPLGCRPYFDEIGATDKELLRVKVLTEQFGELMKSQRGGEDKIADRICDFLNKIGSAYSLSQHYFISIVVSANANLDFAFGSSPHNTNFYPKPKAYPLYPKRREQINQYHPPESPIYRFYHDPRNCHHPSCENLPVGTISHDTYSDGSTPKWESHLVLNVLTPGVLMAPLLEETKSVVLASGSLAPIQSLCAELHLLPPENSNSTSDKKIPNLTIDKKILIRSTPIENEKDNNLYMTLEKEREVANHPLSTTGGRLQVIPKPLEANHVINLPRQLLALGIGHFPDGTVLKVTKNNYSRKGYLDKLGGAISALVEAIPRGGVLAWKKIAIWTRLIASKGEVVVEPSGSSQDEFEEARRTFNATVKLNGACVLLAVFRGKMSEGVSFNDDYARGVICVGVPLPSFMERSIKAKKAYNNEQRKHHKKKLLSGEGWYSQQAYRAIAQAIGRCIRHSADYGTVVLLDSRHCDDGHYDVSGIPQAHSNLPKWMRHSVRTLRMDRRQRANNDVLGGWRGLKDEMEVFFREAPIHCDEVRRKQKEDFKKMQERSNRSEELTFDRVKGKWSPSPSQTKQN